VVTADHGMVDVGADARVDCAADAELSAGIRLLTGEPRARYIHAVDGAAGDVLACWNERLGDRMRIVSGDAAVDAGWFGDVAPHVRPRVGDVVAVATVDDVAIVDSSRMSASMLALVGMHGALTRAELLVPLLVAHL
jgi:hypothetical protein